MITLPEQAPEALLADKGYDADAIRADLANRNIQAVIPGRSNRRVKINHDRVLYKQRNRIERMFGRLKINRAIATRYDQLAESFMSMVHIATARYWLKFVHAAYRRCARLGLFPFKAAGLRNRKAASLRLFDCHPNHKFDASSKRCAGPCHFYSIYGHPETMPRDEHNLSVEA